MKTRSWPIGFSLLTVGGGVAYVFLWPLLIRHSKVSYWLVPGDLWLLVRDAHYVAWGALPFIYSGGTGLIALPGIAILLAPLAAVTGHTGLTESYGLWLVPHATAWLVYGPVSLILGCSVLFAADAWARRLGLEGWRRGGASFTAAVVAWSTTALWGHPEDALALALALWCLLNMVESRLRRAGWLFGVAVCFQPMVLLLLPLILGMLGLRAAIQVLGRAAFLPACLAAAVLAVDPTDAFRALVEQTAFPRIDQPTPWSLLSPSLGHQTIGAGPARMVAFLVIGPLGLVAWRRRRYLPGVLWLGACMMASRVVFDSVDVAYYVMPCFVLVVTVAWAELPAWRALLSSAACVGTMVEFSHRGPMWDWWLTSTGLVLATLALSCPWLGARRAPAVVERRRAIGEPAEEGAALHHQGPFADSSSCMSPPPPQAPVLESVGR